MLFSQVRTKPLLMGDVAERLTVLSLVRRRAILFALEADLSPEEVIGLTWKQLGTLRVSPLARALARINPHHFKLPYIFWETHDDGVVSPLFGLAQSFLEFSEGLGWESYRELYKKVLWLDVAADGADVDRQLKVFQESHQ